MSIYLARILISRSEDSIKIILGITGGIAAYKTPDLVRKLRASGHIIKVILTQTAKSFVSELSLNAVSEDEVLEDTQELIPESSLFHIKLARWADLILIAPATAHFIAKLTQGFSDDVLSAVCLASSVRMIIVPAMNQGMWQHPATRENVEKLRQRGILFLGPDDGSQACGDTGPGRMLDPTEIDRALLSVFVKPLWKGKSILITAGPTQEFIDPIRYFSNRSSGKMGYSLAQAAVDMGAKVTLVSGPVALKPPRSCQTLPVRTAHEMWQAVQETIKEKSAFIGAAAVSDYYCPNFSPNKIKKSQQRWDLELQPTVDILAEVSQLNSKRLIIGFSAETENSLFLAEEKRKKKGADLMVVNDVGKPGIGFDMDYNEVTVLTPEHPVVLAREKKYGIALSILEIASRWIK